MSCLAKSQTASVEKKMFGFSLGLFKAGFEYEPKLDRKWALHTEIGLQRVSYTVESNNPDVKDRRGMITLPYIEVEPRFYYGLDRRTRLGKNTHNNSSNYFSLKTSYLAGNLPITNSDKTQKIVPAIIFVPMFGIRRSFSKNFNYEFAFGPIGYQYNIFSDSKGCNCGHDGQVFQFEAKIGYNF